VTCTACGFDNPANVKFCGSCGRRLGAGCPSCGAESPPGFRFCGECGKPLASAAKASTQGNPRSAVQANHFFGERSLQHGEKVGSVGDVAMGAVETLAFLAHWLNEQHPAVFPAAELPSGFESNRKVRQLVSESEVVQRPNHVRGHDDAGADFTELGCLLVDRHREMLMPQEQRGRESAEPAAHDRDCDAHGALRVAA
jgi:hypothetical protein